MTAQIKKIQTNKVFQFLTDSKKRVKSLRGGTRSGKTYNILIYFIFKYLKCSGKTLTIARETMPALRATAMRDFFEILEYLDLYSEANHNKTQNEYNLNGNLIEFIGLRESRRTRGRKRDDLFINEVNETTKESFRQLAFRTADEIVVDYNPSEPYSWVYDDIEARSDCELFVTTYKDNPFLESAIVEEIERLKETDQDYWLIYGLGEKAGGSTLIYNHWTEIENYPYQKGERVVGIDFGYNNPTAVIEVIHYDDCLFWRELLYETRLTTADLIERLKSISDLRGVPILADSAEPKTIEDIQREGFRIEPAYKIVKDGINFVKSKKLFIDTESTNLLREIKRYSWRKDARTEQLLDEPVKFDDHLLDAARYASWFFNKTSLGNLSFGNLERESPYASFGV